MVSKLLVCFLLSAGAASAQNADSTKRPLLTLQSRVLPPWVIAGGAEVYAWPRHSLMVMFGTGYYYFGGADNVDQQKFKTFEYRFYFGHTIKKHHYRSFFLSPSLKLTKMIFDTGEGYMSPDWLDYTGDNKTVSLLLGKRRYLDNNFNFEIYLGPAYTSATTVERRYLEAEKTYEYNSYESSFWRLRVGFSIGCTFYTKKKKR